MRDFDNLFIQRLLHQLVYDGIINEDETLILLQRLIPISFLKTNNDKKAIRTLNEFIFQVKVEFDYFSWGDDDFHKINYKINDTLVGASRTKKGDYGRPSEDMRMLIKHSS